MENQRIPSDNFLFYMLLIVCSFLFFNAAASYKLVKPIAQDSTTAAQGTPTQMSIGASETNSLPRAHTSSTFERNDVVQVLGIKVGGMFAEAVPRSKISVNDNILILVSNPRALLALKPTDQSELILYADQLPLKGIRTTYFTQLGKNELNDKRLVWPDSVWIPFIFSRDSSNAEAWNTLFRVTGWDKNITRFHLSLGWEGMYPIQYGNTEIKARIFQLFLYNTKVFWAVLGCYLGFLIFFIWLCKTTGLIREPDTVPSGLGPFSLAQTQLAFWTVIIIGGFIYLTILTGLTNSLNDSSLLLLGITGGTTGVASFIDYFKKDAINGIKPATNDPDSSGFVKPKRGFLRDISSDGINLNVQRAQTIMWNLVLGIYFIWYVIANKAMPVFSNTLLTLAGVSSLVYLSSKGPEKPVPQAKLESNASKNLNQT
ncbi:MAG: hypothetical protein JWQ28_2349 [Pedobacter sp.]|jgi:hypothetical protein|nr:hypothetical protein [Pedobacter sp.]